MNPIETLPVDLDVWLLAGQSNMEGVGELDKALPPHPKVLSFTSGGRWELAAEPLHQFWKSFTPVHQTLCRGSLPKERQALDNIELARLEEKERRFGCGLGMTFGRTMVEATGRPVGLIPCAHGATNLKQWSPSLRHQGGHSLYGAMFERIARCGRRPNGILWYQGESEAWDLDAASKWGEQFSAWVEQLRAELSDPALPVLIVQIGSTTLDSPIPAAWNAVQHAQYALPLKLARTAVTSAVDLTLVDAIHLDAVSLQRLGRRLAKLALAVRAGRYGSEIGPRCLRAVQRLIPGGGAEIDLDFSGVAGGWNPIDRIKGFSIVDRNRHSHPNTTVLTATRHPQNPSSIRITVSHPLAPSELLIYGQGLSAGCSAVDNEDMPICASSFTVSC